MICLDPKDPDQEKLAQYRLVHPHGTVPCLEIENQTTILESGAICMYLAELLDPTTVPGDKAAYYKYVYSKTCLEQPLKNRQNKDLNYKW